MSNNRINTACWLLTFMAAMFIIFPANRALSQSFGVKTNIPYLGTTTPNLGLELGVGAKWSIEVTGGYNRWDPFNNIMIRHWIAQTELRYWLCNTFEGHFFGLHAQGGQFNVAGLSLPGFWFDRNSSLYRYQGFFVGGGISYGYQWVLSNRWSLEATLGVGYNYMKYEMFDFEKCGTYHGWRTPSPGYFGPTKLGVSLVYLIW